MFDIPTPVQTPATIIDSAVIYPCCYLWNDHTDTCYCRNWKVTSIRVRFFPNFWLQVRVRKKNAESCRSRLRIRSHLCYSLIQEFRMDQRWVESHFSDFDSAPAPCFRTTAPKNFETSTPKLFQVMQQIQKQHFLSEITVSIFLYERHKNMIVYIQAATF